MKICVALLLLCIAVTGLLALGHHSDARYFDLGRTITITGVISKVLWVNPHAILLVKTSTKDGQTETVALYGMATHAIAASTSKEKFKEGLSITTVGNPARG